MRRKGVLYDVGRVLGVNWRPVFDPKVVHRELEIIRDDLHCNAVKICGRDLDRLTFAAEAALALGLEVWFYPDMIWEPKESFRAVADFYSNRSNRARTRSTDAWRTSTPNDPV